MAELARDYIQLRGVQAQIAVSDNRIWSRSQRNLLHLTKTPNGKGSRGPDLDIRKRRSPSGERSARTLPTLRRPADGADQRPEPSSQLSPPSSLRGELVPSQADAADAATACRLACLPSSPAGAPTFVQAEAQLHAADRRRSASPVADFYPSVTIKRQRSDSMRSIFRNLWKGSSLQYAFWPFRLTADLRGRPPQVDTWNFARLNSRRRLSPITRPCFRPGTKSSTPWWPIGPNRSGGARLKAQIDHARQESLALSRVRSTTRGVADFITVLLAEQHHISRRELQYVQSTIDRIDKPRATLQGARWRLGADLSE